MHQKLMLILALSTAPMFSACSDLPDEVPPEPAAGSGGGAGAKPANSAGTSGSKGSAGSSADVDAGEADAG
jgi:hypothetical protein